MRVRPERKLGAARAEDVFPADLVPLASVPEVREDPDLRGQVIVRHLLRYLAFTAKLEHLVVNQSAMVIADDGFGFLLPDAMREDAYRIYCDEGYHALFSARMAREVSTAFGVDDAEVEHPFFLSRLHHLLDRVGSEFSALLFLLFVVCSETLISRTLLDVGRNGTVAPGVKELIEDHAHDESRHHAYFAAVLREVWVQLSDRARREVGPLVPDLIRAFLEPDRPAMQRELRGYGFDEPAIDGILTTVLDAAALSREMQATARQTIRHFREVGALDDPRTQAAFEESGFWPLPA